MAVKETTRYARPPLARTVSQVIGLFAARREEDGHGSHIVGIWKPANWQGGRLPGEHQLADVWVTPSVAAQR